MRHPLVEDGDLAPARGTVANCRADESTAHYDHVFFAHTSPPQLCGSS